MKQDCPTDDVIFALALGEVKQSDRGALEEHVRECVSCREALSEALLSLSSPHASEEPLQELLIPRVDRYQLREVIGSGGAGIVYMAFDPTLHRQVALKLLRSTDDAPRVVREKLLREARAIAKLSHPNVVTVYDVGESKLGVFLVLEYHPGGSLESWRKDHGSIEESLELLLQAGDGLRAAHEQGVIHRDFKPHNVLISAAGRACVTDFGLAGESSFSDAPFSMEQTVGSATRTRGLAGTPTYMAPEVLAGGRADELADQYSFCVAAYSVLNGKHPFGVTTGSTLAELIARVRGDLYEECGEQVPEHIARALRKGLSVTPSARFSSMNELLAALRAPSQTRWSGRKLWSTAVLGGVIIFSAGWLLVSDPKVTSAPRAATDTTLPSPKGDSEVSDPTPSEDTEQKIESAEATSTPTTAVPSKRVSTPRSGASGTAPSRTRTPIKKNHASQQERNGGKERYNDQLRDPF